MADRPERSAHTRDPEPVEAFPWRYVLQRMMRKFFADHCPDLAAGLTFHTVIAIFPALVACLSLLSLLGQAKNSAKALLQIVHRLNSIVDVDAVLQPLEQLIRTPAAGLAFGTGLVVALWSASAYVGAFGRALNRIYGIPEGRPFWRKRPMMVLITFAIIVLVILAVILLVATGPIAEAIGEALNIGDTTLFIWNVAKWPGLLIVAVLIVAVLYYATPNIKHPRVPWMTRGALLAIGVWALASVGFGVYVANFSKYSNTYGSLAGIIVFLLWLWISNMALLLGAEFNAEVERARELQAGIEAEEFIQVTLRDTAKSDRAADHRAREILEGRDIRLRNAHGSSSRHRR